MPTAACAAQTSAGDLVHELPSPGWRRMVREPIRPGLEDGRYRESCLRKRKRSPHQCIRATEFRRRGLSLVPGKEEQRGRKVARKSPPTGAPRFSCSSLTGHSISNPSPIVCSRPNPSAPFLQPHTPTFRLQPFLSCFFTEDSGPSPCGNGLSHSSVNRLPATRCPS